VTSHVRAPDIILCLATTSCFLLKSALKLGSILAFDLMKYLPDGGVYENCLPCPGELQGVANMKTLLKWVPPASPCLQEQAHGPTVTV